MKANLDLEPLFYEHGVDVSDSRFVTEHLVAHLSNSLWSPPARVRHPADCLVNIDFEMPYDM